MKATVSIETLRAAITSAMAEAHGHIPIAAKTLGVSRRTLARWLVQLPDVPRAPRGFHIAKQ
jgi:transcriptional regulator of acetoin/glycerol metabolism